MWQRFRTDLLKYEQEDVFIYGCPFIQGDRLACGAVFQLFQDGRSFLIHEPVKVLHSDCLAHENICYRFFAEFLTKFCKTAVSNFTEKTMKVVPGPWTV